MQTVYAEFGRIGREYSENYSGSPLQRHRLRTLSTTASRAYYASFSPLREVPTRERSLPGQVRRACGLGCIGMFRQSWPRRPHGRSGPPLWTKGPHSGAFRLLGAKWSNLLPVRTCCRGRCRVCVQVDASSRARTGHGAATLLRVNTQASDPGDFPGRSYCCRSCRCASIPEAHTRRLTSSSEDRFRVAGR